jgi:molybdate-binding protein
VPVAVGVAKVEFGEVDAVPAEFADTTSKSYVVPAVKPINVTEWLVVNAVFRVDEEP